MWTEEVNPLKAHSWIEGNEMVIQEDQDGDLGLEQ